MHKRIISILLAGALAASAAAFSGCGKKEEAPSQAETTQGAETTAASESGGDNSARISSGEFKNAGNV